MAGTENMSAEQDADLRRLEAMAAEGEPAPDQPGQPADMAPPVDPADSWAAIPAMVGGVLAIAFPELRAVYTVEACQQWGAAMVPVAEKYGWSADGLMGPEIGLLAASLPFVIGTAGALRKARAQAIEQEKPAAKPAPLPVTPQAAGPAATVTFGAPVENV